MFVEPNAFEHALHRNVSAVQLAADFKQLHAVLKESREFSSKFPDSIIIGPSTTGAKTKTLSYLSQYVLFIKSLLHSLNHSSANELTSVTCLIAPLTFLYYWLPV